MGIPVSYRIGKTIAAALALNLSRGGMAMRISKPPARGTAVKVKFALPGSKRELETEGVVCWSDQKAGMGMRFTKVKAADQAVIDGFVEAHFFRSVEDSKDPVYVNRRSRTALATTSADAPVSASTAIHSVATPATARTTNATFSPIAIATLMRMFASVALLRRIV